MTVTTILGAIGLAGACGLNPMTSLLLTGLLVRAGWVDLTHDWLAIGDTAWLIAFAVLYLSDVAIDRLAIARGGALHRGGVIVPPLVGALLFASHAGGHVTWVVALVLGGGTAALLHGARAVVRPAAASARRGEAVPGLHTTTMSLLEDAAAGLLVIVSFSSPALGGGATIVLLVAAIGSAWGRRRVAAPA